MTKADFVWSIGYQGDTAIINKKMKGSLRNLDSLKLLEEGLLRPSFCSVLWDSQKDPAVLDAYFTRFSEKTGLKVALADVQRLLGVYQVPATSVRTLEI